MAWYVEEFGGDGCVYVFGGGHLAQETVPLLAHLGFRCIVLEDREEFARKELFSGAERVCLVQFDKLVQSKENAGEKCRIRLDENSLVMRQAKPDGDTAEAFQAKSDAGRVTEGQKPEELSVQQQDYILIMTRGHSCDLEAERFALGTPAGYIGVVGSTRKAAFLREKLSQEGFSREELDRVISPVGLKIGGDTPAEIAVSIAAQLVSVRAKKRKHV